MKLLIYISLLLFVFSYKASGFVTVNSNRYRSSAILQETSNLPDFTRISEFAKQRVEKLSNFGNVLEEVKENITEGEMGKRGEEWFVTQVTIVLCIFIGNVPILGTVLKVVLGPVLCLVGLLTILISLTDLGGSLTPWVEPSKGALITNGIFSKVRHPIYSGLLGTMFGFSILSESVVRLIFTMLLFFVLYLKSEKEEKALLQKFGEEYSEYMNVVPGKFIPDDLSRKLLQLNDE